MNTDKLMELERKWRDEPTLAKWAPGLKRAADELAAALRAEQAVGEEQRALLELADRVSNLLTAWGDTDMSEERDAIASELRALGTARQPENIGEFVIAMLIAAGYVTQAKVDEARNIALGHGPYEMPARQSEGVVLVPREIFNHDRLREKLMAMFDCGEEYAQERIWSPIISAAAPGGEGEG